MRGRSLAAGDATGEALVLSEPISLWGGLDPATGTITDAHHPQRGASVVRRVLVMPAGRGSSSSASVLAEAVRAGTAPAAILLGEPDLILAIGAAAAEELYARQLPIVVLRPATLGSIRDGERLSVRGAGYVRRVHQGEGDLRTPRKRPPGPRWGVTARRA